MTRYCKTPGINKLIENLWKWAKLCQQPYTAGSTIHVSSVLHYKHRSRTNHNKIMLDIHNHNKIMLDIHNHNK